MEYMGIRDSISVLVSHDIGKVNEQGMIIVQCADNNESILRHHAIHEEEYGK